MRLVVYLLHLTQSLVVYSINEISVISAAHIADETIKVGHANGVTFAKMNSFDISSLEIKNENEIPLRIQTLRKFMESSRLLKRQACCKT